MNCNPPNPFAKMDERVKLNQSGWYYKIVEKGGLQKLARGCRFPHL